MDSPSQPSAASSSVKSLKDVSWKSDWRQRSKQLLIAIRTTLDSFRLMATSRDSDYPICSNACAKSVHSGAKFPPFGNLLPPQDCNLRVARDDASSHPLGTAFHDLTKRVLAVRASLGRGA